MQLRLCRGTDSVVLYARLASSQALRPAELALHELTKSLSIRPVRMWPQVA